MRSSAHFVEGPNGRLFVTLREPRGGADECVLFVPPFAEEMNKSRRMMALAAASLAERGLAAAIPDLSGTGDSEGEFRHARLDAWVEDLSCIQRWLSHRGCTVRRVVGVRLGAALATRWVARTGTSLTQAVLWQPVASGRQMLTQFVRLRVAASLMGEGARESAAQLQARLASGETLEIAGYELSAALAGDLGSVDLPGEAHRGMGSVCWMEIARRSGQDAQTLSTSAAGAVERLRSHGLTVEAEVHAGDPFWSSTEIVVNDAVIASTVERFGP